MNEFVRHNELKMEIISLVSILVVIHELHFYVFMGNDSLRVALEQTKIALFDADKLFGERSAEDAFVSGESHFQFLFPNPSTTFMHCDVKYSEAAIFSSLSDRQRK